MPKSAEKVVNKTVTRKQKTTTRKQKNNIDVTNFESSEHKGDNIDAMVQKCKYEQLPVIEKYINQAVQKKWDNQHRRDFLNTVFVGYVVIN